jgi:hypothetical protein
MSRILVARVTNCSVGRFSRLEQGLLAGGGGRDFAAGGGARGLGSGGADPVLLLASLAGSGLLLGRHQRARSALRLGQARDAGLEVSRRAGGGRALAAGEGTLGLFLWVPPGAALLPAGTSADRVVNRLVRGLLAGLRAAGARDAAYFGRDFASSQGRRVAAVSQEGTEDGGVAFEAIVAVGRSLALPPGLGRYPAHGDPRAGGPPDATVAEIAGEARDAVSTGEAIARGYAEGLGCDLVGHASDELGMAGRKGPGVAGQQDPALAGPEAGAPPVEEDETGLSESGLAEVPIGFVEALVRLEGNRLREARLRGDFQAPAFLVAALERSLEGAAPTFAVVGRRVDEAFERPGAFLRGLDARRTLADAVLAAAAPA